MRLTTKLSMLAIMGGLASCAGMGSALHHSPELESVPLKLLSAKRNHAVWMKFGNEKGAKWLETVHSSWEANRVALGRLENALFEKPWVSMSEYELDGRKWTSSHASPSRKWIDCACTDGRTLRVFIKDHRGEPRIFDGHARGGELGYRLGVSVEECREILHVSEWENLKEWKTVDEPLPKRDESFDRMLSHPGVSFKSSLAHNQGIGPASLLIATRSNLGPIEAGSGYAHGDTLRRLEKAVQGTRWSTLSFTMDEGVQLLERDEEPLERIVCEMSDGKIVVIHVFESDGAWCVVGEGSFRLALGVNDARRLLAPSGWAASD